MGYRELEINKKFTRYHCNEFIDDSNCSFKFRIAYEDSNHNTLPHNYNIKPEFNPLEKAIFDTRQGPFDIYDLSYVLGICRGFLISSKLKTILQEFTLCNHVIFDNIKYTFKGELRNDISFIYFYQDFSDNIDYVKSSFYAETNSSVYTNENPIKTKEDGTFTIINPVKRQEVIVVEDPVKIASYDDYERKRLLYGKEKRLIIRKKSICCPEAMKYDIFTMMKYPVSRSVFVSENLQQRLEKEKIKGVEYAANMKFKFFCKE